MGWNASSGLFRVESCGVPRRNSSSQPRVERFWIDQEPRDQAEQVAVKVTLQEGASWIAVFESGGYESPPGVGYELIEWPDGKSFCIVTGGAGYLVRADGPSQDRIDCFPITAVQLVSDLGLVLFLDFTTVTAYDATRMAWRSPRLAYDQLEVVRLRGNELRLRGWNAPERRTEELTLDLRTGASPDSFYPADRPWLGDLNFRRRR
jgi:hypothetical protein